MKVGVRARILVAALVLVVIAGCGLVGKDDDTAAGAVPAAATPSDAPVPSPTIEEASPSPVPSKTRTSKKPSARPSTASPTPTEDPFNRQLPDCARYVGKAVSFKKAKAALNAAATRTYWPGSAPTLKVPSDLIRSVAWHESGWVSNIENCDGGYGLMQVMPDTEEFVNVRFEKSYDYREYKQNAILGANYLAWLTRYFGEKYFNKNYDLGAGRCRSDAAPCLLNLVIDGYNMGYGSTEAAYLENRKLSNPEYVALIRANMRECDCDRY